METKKLGLLQDTLRNLDKLKIPIPTLSIVLIYLAKRHKENQNNKNGRSHSMGIGKLVTVMSGLAVSRRAYSRSGRTRRQF
jgi:hypothetical protein